MSCVPTPGSAAEKPSEVAAGVGLAVAVRVWGRGAGSGAAARAGRARGAAQTPPASRPCLPAWAKPCSPPGRVPGTPAQRGGGGPGDPRVAGCPQGCGGVRRWVLPKGEGLKSRFPAQPHKEILPLAEGAGAAGAQRDGVYKIFIKYLTFSLGNDTLFSFYGLNFI